MSNRSLSLLVLALVLGSLLSVRWYLEAGAPEPDLRPLPQLSDGDSRAGALYRIGPAPALPAAPRARLDGAGQGEAACGWPASKPLGPDLIERNHGAPPAPDAATASSFRPGVGVDAL